MNIWKKQVEIIMKYTQKLLADYSGDSAPPFRCKRRHLNWADLFYNINQFFSVFFFHKESPFNSNLCALPDNLSIIASATVFSPIYSYSLLTGICEDINVDRLPYRSSSICKSASRLIYPWDVCQNHPG